MVALVVLTLPCVADETAPVITCPASVDVELGTSLPLTSGATDISGTTEITCTSDTADLDVGLTQAVTCTARDASDNHAACTVAVTVAGAQTPDTLGRSAEPLSAVLQQLGACARSIGGRGIASRTKTDVIGAAQRPW